MKLCLIRPRCFSSQRRMAVRGADWCLEVAVVSKLAFDPKPALSVLPVRHAHLFASYLRGFGVRCERDMFLQGAQFLICLSFERVGEDTATRAGIQRRRGQFTRVKGDLGGSKPVGVAGCVRCRCLAMWR